MAELKYWGELMVITGKKGEEVRAGSVAEVLSFVEKQYGKAALKEAKRMMIAVDGTNIQLLERFKTPLSDGATVSFLPLSGGG